MRLLGRRIVRVLGVALLGAFVSAAAPGRCETVLVVIDVQNVYVEELELTTVDGTPLVERLVDVLARARSAGVPIVYVRHRDPRFAPDSPQLAIVAEVAPEPGDPIVWKSFSDAFRDTELQAVLASFGARRVLLCGLATAGCVDATTFRSIRLRYDTWVLADAHAGGADGDGLAYFNALWQDLGAVVEASGAVDFAAFGCAPAGES